MLFSLNPGSFNMEEHVLISIFANAGAAFGNEPANAVYIVDIVKAFYHRNISFFAGWLHIITTQVIVFSFMLFLPIFFLHFSNANHCFWKQEEKQYHEIVPKLRQFRIQKCYLTLAGL